MAAAAFYALVGWRIFRKLMSVLREAQAAVSGLAVAVPPPAADAANAPGRELGIFADPVQARARYEEGKEERREVRRERRISRRLAHGQPRALRDFPGL
ncbi:hypothetical protein OL239_09955 [Arthrobacter sp. ATA002]|uniref:hypothetical protein n=1 Tax=Arthrobacter sp. ATA002 TaxID=2991715 RepID=UPI0022A7A185|nr:hypothetical protein [Arthrobacter sp. ATA002]WAP50405.1 hypothetical protein OL239_09955 [Arthrobacter sp. ATA002]